MSKKTLAVIAVMTGLLAAMLVTLAPSAYATETETETGPSFSTCSNLAGWFVNEDEADRKPKATVEGLKFSGADLIHHATEVKLADLKPGSFSATPEPDQESFFSVELRDATTGAYGTLRWNTGSDKWDLVTDTGAYSKADPADYVGVETKWGKITEATTVVTFGVGYTKNPPGTVDTVVTSVTFNGKTYPLTCAPPVQTTSPNPSTSSSSPAPSTSSSSPAPSKTRASSSATPLPGTTDAAGTPSLPLTGPGIGTFVLVGLAVLAAGGVVVFLTGRRKRFEA